MRNTLSICMVVGPQESWRAIGASLESVARQSCSGLEVTVKTVGSHLAPEMRSFASARAMNLTVLTGDDSGIYDAMNICVSRATGSHVLILGAGDLLADNFVAEDLVDSETTMSMYGPVLLADASGQIYTTFNNDCFFGKRRKFPWRNPCHSQGIVYERRWLSEHPFATNAGPLADLVHTYRHLMLTKLTWVNRPIAIFVEGGASNELTSRALNAQLQGVRLACDSFAHAAMWRWISSLVCTARFAQRRTAAILKFSSADRT